MKSDLDRGYAAGLFEGEGWVGCWVGRGGYLHPYLRINMTDEGPLRRMQGIFGGNINGPYERGPDRKPIYAWGVNGWDALEAIHAEIGEQLSPRRQSQFQEVLVLAPPPARRGHGWRNREKTHCSRGHEFSPDNTYTYEQDGGCRRVCKTCVRDRRRAAREL